MNILKMPVYILLLSSSIMLPMHEQKKLLSANEFIKNVPNDVKTDHSQWPTIINTQFDSFKPDDPCLQFNLRNDWSSYYYKNQKIEFPKITLTKSEMIQLSFEKINLINTAQTHHRTNSELILFNQLPDDLCNNLKNYFYSSSDGGYHLDTNYRIKFFYKKKWTLSSIKKSMFNECKNLLPCIISTLLYHHLYCKPMESLWTLTQDPSDLEANQKKELTNILIETLQNNAIPGSDLLTKLVINPVPFEWKFPADPVDRKDEYFDHRIKKGIISFIVVNAHLLYSPCFPSFKSKYHITRQNSEYDQQMICLSFILYNGLVIAFLYIIPELSKIVFSLGTLPGLTSIVIVVCLYGIIKEILNACITKEKSIDFPKEKFKNMSTKEVISYYQKKYNIA